MFSRLSKIFSGTSQKSIQDQIGISDKEKSNKEKEVICQQLKNLITTLVSEEDAACSLCDQFINESDKQKTEAFQQLKEMADRRYKTNFTCRLSSSDDQQLIFQIMDKKGKLFSQSMRLQKDEFDLLSKGSSSETDLSDILISYQRLKAVCSAAKSNKANFNDIKKSFENLQCLVSKSSELGFFNNCNEQKKNEWEKPKAVLLLYDNMTKYFAITAEENSSGDWDILNLTVPDENIIDQWEVIDSDKDKNEQFARLLTDAAKKVDPKKARKQYKIDWKRRSSIVVNDSPLERTDKGREQFETLCYPGLSSLQKTILHTVCNQEVEAMMILQFDREIVPAFDKKYFGLKAETTDDSVIITVTYYKEIVNELTIKEIKETIEIAIDHPDENTACKAAKHELKVLLPKNKPDSEPVKVLSLTGESTHLFKPEEEWVGYNVDD
ncbi:MAG: hypothetical protein OXC48_10450 [Endozoicomonadaceae bacterium]|nr:hypothetical protein [Endozoicomonadaceae bacterium]